MVLLQALFATMATELDAHTDLVAERLVVLGGVARGTVRTAATHSRHAGVSAARSWMATPMCEALTECFASCATALRADIAHATEVEDAGSAALYTDISRGVDQRQVLGRVPLPRWGEHSINAPRWQSSSVSQWTSESVNAVERGHGREGLSLHR